VPCCGGTANTAACRLAVGGCWRPDCPSAASSALSPRALSGTASRWIPASADGTRTDETSAEFPEGGCNCGGAGGEDGEVGLGGERGGEDEGDPGAVPGGEAGNVCGWTEGVGTAGMRRDTSDDDDSVDRTLAEERRLYAELAEVPTDEGGDERCAGAPAVEEDGVRDGRTRWGSEVADEEECEREW